MRRLHLLRHAKSSWADEQLDDHDRPLNDRGRDACGLLTEHLLAQRFTADLVLASTARRVAETLDGISAALRADTPIRFDDRLYTGDARELRVVIAEVPIEVATLLLVGHNPAIGDLAVDLADDDGPIETATALREKYPTGAFASYEIEGPWTSLAASRLLGFVRPRDIGTPESGGQRSTSTRWPASG